MADATDNCPAVANAGQQNTYGDTRGDACEPDTFRPTLSAFDLPPRFRAGKRTTIKLTLDEAATVRFTVKRRDGGRRVHGRCSPPTRSNSRARKCDLQLRGAFARIAMPGTNRFTWNGMLRGKRLAVGRYLLIATPRDTAGNKGTPRKAAFQIVR